MPKPAREWMTAADLATLRLGKADLAALGMRAWPGTVQGINKRAGLDGWEGRKIGSSQAWEYRVSSLPAAAQKALARNLVRSAPTHLPAQAPIDLPAATDLKTHQRSRMDARLALLNHLQTMEMTSGISQGKAVLALVDAANKGELPPDLQRLVPIANARPNDARGITRGTVYNWLNAKVKADGNIVALAPKGVPEAPVPVWAPIFVELHNRPSNPGIAECLDRWPEGIERPSYDQVRRFIRRLDALTKNAGRMGPKALQQLKAYVSRDTSQLWPGAVFVGDGHTFKAEITHPLRGGPFRPEVTSFIDVFTRRWCGWSAALSENTWSVADALRHAVTVTTCCDIVYYDNGSGAKNKIWDDDVTGLIARLSITKLHSAPWSSQARGIVERFHSSVMHTAARWLPTYVGQRLDEEAGHKVFKVTRKEIAATGTSKLLPSWGQFLDYVEEIMVAYNNTPHSGLPKLLDETTGKRRHMTPNEMWAKEVAGGWVPAPIGEGDAVDLFRPEITRKTTRGLVQLFGNVYFNEALTPLYDERVRVRYDIHDATKVWVYLLDGRFVCTAGWDAHKRSYVPVSVATQARDKRVAGMVARLDDHRETALAEATPNLSIQYQRVPEASPISPAEQARLEAMEAEWEEIPAVEEQRLALDGPKVVQLDTRETRYRRALAIQTKSAAGAEVSAEDAIWLIRYQALPEYWAMHDLHQDFGDEFLTG